MRTTSGAVAAILNQDYDGKANLVPYIRGASAITDRVSNLAVQRLMGLTPVELQEIETWLAAHFYACSDKPFAQNTTEGASATYQGQTKMGFEATLYGQTALRLDWSGSLEAIDKRKIAKGFWAGTVPPWEPFDPNEPVVSDPGPGNTPG